VRDLLLCFATCCICAAQSISIGGIGGGRLTDDVQSSHTPESNVVAGVPVFQLQSRFYEIGPTLEIGLPHGFSLEADAIYHRQGFFYTFYHDTQYFTHGERDNTWEFPVLLKYRLPFPAIQPFVEAGVSPRTMHGQSNGTLQFDVVTLGAPSLTSFPADYSPTVGFVAGGGVRFNIGHLRISPQLRYTRWFTTPISGMDGNIVGGTFASNLNQVDVLVGIGWRLR